MSFRINEISILIYRIFLAYINYTFCRLLFIYFNMQNLNVLVLGPSSFYSTLNELRIFLKFNPLQEDTIENPNITLFHIDVLQIKKQKKNSKCLNSQEN